MKILTLFLVCCYAIVSALLLVQSPELTIALNCIIAFCISFWFFPEISLFFFLIFLLFQGVTVYLTRIGIIYNLDEFIILLLVVLLILKKLVNKQHFVKSNIRGPLFVLIIVGLLSTFIYQIVPYSVAFGGLLLFLKGFFVYYILLNMSIGDKDLRKFSRLFYGMGLFTFFYGLLGAIWPKIFLASIGISFQGRFGIPALQSYLGHPGAFAALMGVLFCFSFVEALTRKSLRHALLSIVFLLGIIFSLRRTTLAGVILATLFVFWFKGIRDKVGSTVSFKLTGAILAILILFSGIIFVLYKDLATSYLSQESPRSLLFKTGVKISKDYFPLGSGFGTFSGGINQKFYSPLFYKYGLSNTWGLSEKMRSYTNDTFWPHILAETGVFGFLCYVWIIVVFFSICFKAIRNFRGQAQSSFAITAIMLMILSLVESTKGTFYEMSLWTFFYFGCVAILQSWLAKKGNNESSPSQ